LNIIISSPESELLSGGRRRLLVTALIFEMYFSTVIPFAAIPFLVGAVPISKNSSRTDGPISIPLSKRSIRLNDSDDGLQVVDLEKLKASVHHTTAFVLPLLFL
jgi:hypothetical protein